MIETLTTATAQQLAFIQHKPSGPDKKSTVEAQLRHTPLEGLTTSELIPILAIALAVDNNASHFVRGYRGEDVVRPEQMGGLITRIATDTWTVPLILIGPARVMDRMHEVQELMPVHTDSVHHKLILPTVEGKNTIVKVKRYGDIGEIHEVGEATGGSSSLGLTGAIQITDEGIISHTVRVNQTPSFAIVFVDSMPLHDRDQMGINVFPPEIT